MAGSSNRTQTSADELGKSMNSSVAMLNSALILSSSLFMQRVDKVQIRLYSYWDQCLLAAVMFRRVDER